MKYIIIFGAILAAGFILAKFLTIGRLHGQKIVPLDLLKPSVRLGLKISKAKEALAECMKLPPRERLVKLLELEERFSAVYFASDEIRKAIVATGTDQTIPHFRRILRDPRRGAHCVVFGIRDALNSETLEDGYRVEAIKLLIDGLNDKELFGSVSSDRIPELLICLDSEWAARILGDICEREPDHYLFAAIYKNLLEYKLPVNPLVTESILAKNGVTENPTADGMNRINAALSLLQTNPVLADQILEEMMKTQPPFVVAQAAEALLEVRDLPHPRYLLNHLQSSQGFGVLNDFEKAVWLADQCGYYLGMDYLYLFESEEEGNRLQEMHEALVRVGAIKAATMLEAYIKLYGPDGPSKNVVERMKFAEAKGEEAWNESITAIKNPDGWEEITELAIQYELKHGDQFRKASEIRKILNYPEKSSAFNR